MPLNKQCSSCGEVKPADREHFGSQPNGNLRHVCRTCMNKRSKSYAKGNPESVRRRAIKRKQQADNWKPTNDLKIRLAVEQKGLCALCSHPIDKDDLFDGKEVQVEHLTPVSKGGTNDENNLVIAHRSCNQEKAGKTMREYWMWRENVGLPKIPHLTEKMIEAITNYE